MKTPKILMVAGVSVVITVMVLIGVVGANMTQTVGRLDVALAEVENEVVIARTSIEEIAIDPTEVGYVAPLGENKITAPDESRVLATAVGVQGMVVGALAICFLAIISLAVRYWQRGHSSE